MTARLSHAQTGVIPGRRAAANPEPMNTGRLEYGFLVRAFGTPRNDKTPGGFGTLAIVAKSEAEEWLARAGESE